MRASTMVIPSDAVPGGPAPNPVRCQPPLHTPSHSVLQTLGTFVLRRAGVDTIEGRARQRRVQGIMEPCPGSLLAAMALRSTSRSR